MKYDVKMNIKRALSLYLATSVIATNPGTIAAATALVNTTEDTTAVVKEVVEVEEYLEETTEEAVEEVADEVVEEETAEEVVEVPEQDPAMLQMSLDADIPSAISSGAYTSSAHYDWNSTTAANITVSGIDKYTYITSTDGAKPVPLIYGRDSTGKVITLSAGDDYRVSYSNHQMPGVGTLTVTGLGNYGGQTYDHSYNIAANLSDMVITFDGDKGLDHPNYPQYKNIYYTYTGNVIEPTVTATLFGQPMVEDTHFTVTQATADSTKTGVYKMNLACNPAIFTVGTLSISYVVEGQEISGLAEIAAIDNSLYFGVPVTPTVSVSLKSDADTKLTLNTDYTVSYANNNAEGTATVTVTGIGNYAGTMTKDFIIKNDRAINQFAGANSEISGLTFGACYGTALTAANFSPTVKYNLNGTMAAITKEKYWTGVLITAADATDAEAYAKDLAEHKAGIVTTLDPATQAALDNAGYAGENNYYVALGIGSFFGSYSVSDPFPIFGRLSNATVAVRSAADSDVQTNWTWTGDPVKPTYWDVKLGNQQLVEGVDFEVTYPEDITSVGTKTVTITHFGASAGATSANGTTMVYDSVFYNTTTAKYVVEAASFSIDNVEDVTDGVLDTEELFTGDPIIPDFKITLDDASEQNKTYLVQDTDYSVTCTSNVGNGIATATIKGLAGYAGVSFTVQFEIIADVDTNQFGVDDTSGDADGSKLTFSDLKGVGFIGTPYTESNFNPSITWAYNDTKTTTLLKGTHYEGYLINDYTGIDVVAIIDDIIAGDDEDALLASYEDAFTDVGLPGKHYYLMIGTGMCEGSYWYTDVDVYGNLKYATVSPMENTETDDQKDPVWEASPDWDYKNGADIKPEAWLVKIGNYVLTEGVDFDVEYPTDISSIGTKNVTIKHADFENESAAGVEGSTSFYYNSATSKYAVTAVTFDEEDIFGGVTDGVMDDQYKFTGVNIDPEIAIWKDYDNDYDDQAATPQNPTDNPELFLIKGTDYSYSCTNNMPIGNATATITGLGGYTGVKFTVDFEIVADLDNNVFEDTTTFTAISDLTFVGDTFTSSDVKTSASCVYAPGKNLALTEGTWMTSMILNLGTTYDTTDFDANLNTLLDTIMADITAHEADPDNVDLSDAVQGYVDNAGLPGLHLYVVRGLESFEGSYAATSFNINADLSKATLTWYDKDPAGTYTAGEEAVAVEDYYASSTAFDVFPELTLKDYVFAAGAYTLLPTDTSIATLKDLTTSTGTKALTLAAAADFVTGTRAETLLIKGYDLADEDAVITVTLESDVDYLGYSVSNVPSAVKYVLDAYTHDGLVQNVDYTVSYSNLKNVAASTADNAPTVTFTGIGLYEGTHTETFNIVLNADSYLTIEEIETQEYANASAITPTPKVTVTVTDDATGAAATYTETYTLVEGIDYEYSYANNYLCGVDAATLTVTGLGNYATITPETATFTIAANMEDVVVSDIATQEYTAEEIALTYDDQALATSDFTIKYNNVDLIMSTEDHADVLDDNTGATVHDGDFYVTYEDNTDIGTATVTFHAVDGSAFHGSTTATFEIDAIDLSDYVINLTTDADVGFTGDYVTPKFTLDYVAPTTSSYALTTPTPTLTAGTDYTVEYFNNVKVADGSAETFTNGGTGVQTPYIKVTGLGIYEGSVVYGGFEIEAGAYNLFEGGTAVGLIATKAYDGTVQTQTIPALTIVDPLTGGTKNIFPGTDFAIGGTITDVLGLPDGTAGSHVAGNYTAGGDADPAKDGYTGNVLPGEATMYLIGINDYVDSYVEVNFDVIADLANAAIYYKNSTAMAVGDTESATGTYDWTGSDVAPTLDVIFDYADATKKLTLGYDADAALSTYVIDRDDADTGAGDKTITITAASNDLGKYYKGTLSGSYTIDQIDVSTATKSDADPLGDVTYTAEDLEYAYTSLVQLPSHEDLELAFGNYELTEDDYTIALKSGSDGIGTGTDPLGDAMICVITGAGNFTGSFEVTYTILEADVDALLETAYLDDIATQTFVGSMVSPATKVWVEIDGKYVDETDKFNFFYDTAAASGTAQVRAVGKDGTVYAGGRVDNYFELIGDLSKATMTFNTNEDGVLQVQAHYVRGDGTICEIPASAYSISGVTVNTANSTMTFTAQGVASQFYTGTMTGTTSFGKSMDREALMPADETYGNSDGILSETEFMAAFDAYKAQSGYGHGDDWGTNSMPYATYQGGVHINSTECASMVYQLADWIFGAGSAPASGATDGVAVGEYDHYVVSMDQLRIGDYAYTGSHWVLITGIKNGVYTLAEGNFNSVVNYGRTVTAADFPSETTTFYSRYPYAK